MYPRHDDFKRDECQSLVLLIYGIVTFFVNCGCHRTVQKGNGRVSCRESQIMLSGVVAKQFKRPTVWFGADSK